MTDSENKPRRARKAAATTPEPKPVARNGVYLPALPKGWTYAALVATGPDGATVTVAVDGLVGDALVTVESRGMEARNSKVATFADGARKVGEATKVLAKINEAERAALRARGEGLSLLGETESVGEEQPDEPTPDPDAGDPDAPAPDHTPVMSSLN